MEKGINEFQGDLLDELIKSYNNTENHVVATKEKSTKIMKNIFSALVNNKKILMMGDYDVDGFFSTLSLETYIKVIQSRIKNSSFSSNIDIAFSDRKIGYSLTESKFLELKEKYDMFIFIDTGSEYEYLEKYQKDVIVIDHHPTYTQGKKEKEYLYNLNLDGSNSTSSGEVVYNLIENFEDELRKHFGSEKIQKHDGVSYAKMLCSITLISDMANMDGEHIEFVKDGLDIINSNKKNFYFLEKMGKKNITTQDLSFNLINIINSYSRMNKNLIDIASLFQVNIKSDKLLHFNSRKCDEKIYNTLLEVHSERKKIVSIMENEVEKIIDDKCLNHGDTNIVNLSDKHQYTGINGLLAQHSLKITSKPSLVISFDNNKNLYVGSGRGYGVKKAIQDTINTNSSKFSSVSFGGHDMACGVSIPSSLISCFEKQFTKQSISHEDDISNSIENVYKSDIESFKNSCDEYLIRSSGVSLDCKFYVKLEDYKYSDFEKSNNNWYFVTVYDKKDYLNLFVKSKDLDTIRNKEPLILEIINKDPSKNSFFISNIGNTEKKIEKLVHFSPNKAQNL